MKTSLAERLQWLGFRPNEDFTCQDNSDGEGPFIAQWLSDSPRPTEREIAEAVPPTPQEIDTDTLNAALTAEGSVVRALALLMLQEINALRQRASLPQYSQQQLVDALKTKMR